MGTGSYEGKGAGPVQEPSNVSNKGYIFCYLSPYMSYHILNKYSILKSFLRQIFCRLQYELCVTPTESLIYLEIEFYPFFLSPYLI